MVEQSERVRLRSPLRQSANAAHSAASVSNFMRGSAVFVPVVILEVMEPAAQALFCLDDASAKKSACMLTVEGAQGLRIGIDRLDEGNFPERL